MKNVNSFNTKQSSFASTNENAKPVNKSSTPFVDEMMLKRDIMMIDTNTNLLEKYVERLIHSDDKKPDEPVIHSEDKKSENSVNDDASENASSNAVFR
jgi:hypothetical protein